MVTVNIRDGVDTRNEAYDYMKQKVLNGEKLLNKEIMEKYDISSKAIRKLRVELSEELGVKLYRGKLKAEKKKEPLYYSYHLMGSHFAIQKQIDGKVVSFRTCRTKETAEKIVEELKKVNWDKSKLDEIRMKLGVE